MNPHLCCLSFIILLAATNQAANFTMYQFLKKQLADYQPELETLPTWQHMIAGFISGACGPLSNAPIDTIKTRYRTTLGKRYS